MKTEEKERDAWLERMTEKVRLGQWTNPYPDDESPEEIAIFKKECGWYVFWEYGVYFVSFFFQEDMERFVRSEIGWGKLLNEIIDPILIQHDFTLIEQYTNLNGFPGFTIKDPVIHFYLNGEKQRPEYVEGRYGEREMTPYDQDEAFV